MYKLTIEYTPENALKITSDPEDLGYDSAGFMLDMAKQALIASAFRELSGEESNSGTPSISDDAPSLVDEEEQGQEVFIVDKDDEDEFDYDDDDMLMDEDEFVIDDDDRS